MPGGVRARAQNAVVMVVLGIDPGTANTGYGVVARSGGRLVALDGGVIRASGNLGARLATIHERIGALIAEHAPASVAVEDVYFGSNVRTAFAVGQARGVILLATRQHGLECASYTPQQVKASVCGGGRADKGQVQRMVQSLLGLADLPRPDHAADALAVAICHASHAGFAAAARRATLRPATGAAPPPAPGAAPPALTGAAPALATGAGPALATGAPPPPAPGAAPPPGAAGARP